MIRIHKGLSSCLRVLPIFGKRKRSDDTKKASKIHRPSGSSVEVY